MLIVCAPLLPYFTILTVPILAWIVNEDVGVVASCYNHYNFFLSCALDDFISVYTCS